MLERIGLSGADHLAALATETAGKSNVTRLDRDTLCVDGSQVCVFEEADQVGLGSLLKGTNSRALETQVGLEVLCDFTHETLEGQLADQEFRRLLVATNFTQSDGTRLVAVRLLDCKDRRDQIHHNKNKSTYLHRWRAQTCELP